VPAIARLAAAQSEPVILVGHSSGGMIISEVARNQPQNVAALVYLTAFLLPAGATPRDVMGDGSGSLLPEAIVVDPVAGVTTIRPEMARVVFYHDCSDADVAWALERLQPEPLIPPSSRDGPGGDQMLEPAVPRFYLETLQDRALPVAVQRRMYANLPCEAVYTLDTSHSPFLSQPRQLAEMLGVIAERGSR
jgi:pimeloyl-ACP methyl ester carboxylesterase